MNETVFTLGFFVVLALWVAFFPSLRNASPGRRLALITAGCAFSILMIYAALFYTYRSEGIRPELNAWWLIAHITTENIIFRGLRIIVFLALVWSAFQVWKGRPR
jgi:hypothetical protein